MKESKCTHYDPDYTGLCIECGHDLDYTTQSTTDTPYQPEVGEWFIKQNGDKARLIGLMSFGHYVCESIDSCVDVVTSLQGAKPIKTERELFIQQCIDIAGRSGLIPEEAFGKLYSNGARFNEVAE